MDLFEELAATIESINGQSTDAVVKLWLLELEPYPDHDVRHALARCRRELRRLSLADVLDRIPTGHPGVEEAWSMVAPCLRNESISIVWTDEMAEAFGCALRLAEDGIAARMAFREKYTVLVGAARAARRKAVWSPSFGRDRSGRVAAMRSAVLAGRLPAGEIQRLLPDCDEHSNEHFLTDGDRK